MNSGLTDFLKNLLEAEPNDNNLRIAIKSINDHPNNQEIFNKSIQIIAKLAQNKPHLKEIVANYMNQLQQNNSDDDNNLKCLQPVKLSDERIVRFNQIAGLTSTKEELQKSFIYPLQYPSLFRKLSNVLLYGVPGTAKTLLARAACREIENAIFFAPNPGELKSKYEGGSEQRIAALFKCASNHIKNKPNSIAILFFDEFDSLCRKGRGEDASLTRSVNALLQAMDGINSDPRVVVLAATNFLPTELDSAVMRRFNIKIFVDLPDADARRFIIEQRIGEQYVFPHFLKENANKPDVLFTKALENIIEFGQSGQEKEKIKAAIQSLVMQTGPSTIEANKHPEFGLQKPEDKRSGIRIGMSGSDISKMLDNVFNNVASRAIDGRSRYSLQQIDGKNYYVLSTNSNAIPLIEAYKKCPKQLLTFDLKLSDIENATQNYEPTVTVEEYAKFKKFQKQEALETVSESSGKENVSIEQRNSKSYKPAWNSYSVNLGEVE